MLAFARFLLNGFNRFASFLLGIKGAQVTLAVAYISFFTGTAVAFYAALVNAIELIAVNINLSGWALNFVLVAIAFLPDNLIEGDRKSTRLNSSHVAISYAVICLKK